MKYTLTQWLVLACAFTCSLSFSEDYSPEIQAQITSIQKQMRSDLSEGNTEKARLDLEKAGGHFHAIEIELGLIQTLMQAGEYRHALSAAAHTQAEHPDAIDSSLLYVWLMAIGGQTNPAKQLIETTRERHPKDTSLTLLLQQIKARQLIATELKTSTAIQLKPFTPENGAAINSRQYLATGILINNGTQAITWLSNTVRNKTLQLRNGLGRETNASIEKTFPNSKLVILKLQKPLKTTNNITLANKTPFPGNPIYIVGFTPHNNDHADWPQLQVDILGTPTSTIDGYPIHVQHASVGSAVFNQQGALIGVVNDDSKKMIVPLTEVLVAYKNLVNTAQPVSKLPMDEIYESALSNTVQVLGAD
jgi:hypothetical protein